MESNVAKTITTERVRRVSQGYTNTKGVKLMGSAADFVIVSLVSPSLTKTARFEITSALLTLPAMSISVKQVNLYRRIPL